MSIATNSKKLVQVLITISMLLTFSSQAAPILFTGTDAGTSNTTNSDAAFASWSSAVGSFTLDNLNGLTGTGGIGGSLTSALGNTFTTSDDMIGIRSNFH